MAIMPMSLVQQVADSLGMYVDIVMLMLVGRLPP